MTPPNILFILSDQQRWDSVGAYGQALPTTPHIDRLAAEGVRFENAFTCQPVCGPARACLQTGRYASETGCFRNGLGLPEGEPTLPRYLRQAGYDSAYVGKWHLASREHEYYYSAIPPERRGGYDGYWIAADLPEYISSGYAGCAWDRDMQRVDFEGYRADAYTDWALRYLGERPGDRPFFLFVSYVEPHPQPYHKRYRGPPPDDRRGIIRDYMRYDAPKGEAAHFADHDVPGDLAGTDGDWQVAYADYLASCGRVDTNVARLLAELDRQGVADDTLVVYTSDHGCHFHTRTQGDKNSCHDGSIRIPLVVRGPGFRGGRVANELASLIDLPPTLLQAAGLASPATMRGRPLQDIDDPSAAEWRDSVFVQISHRGAGRAVRTSRWKYAVSSPRDDRPDAPGSDTYLEAFLYDLAADPHERDNRVADPSLAAVRAELRGMLVEHMVSTGEPKPTIGPAERA